MFAILHVLPTMHGEGSIAQLYVKYMKGMEICGIHLIDIGSTPSLVSRATPSNNGTIVIR